MISETDLKLLTKLARKSILSEFSKKSIAEEDIEKLKHLSQKQGVFVTLHKNSQLRGCIGFPYPVMPLYKAVIEAAKSAAFSDPRFMPLQESELDEVKIELSVLSVPELIEAKSPGDYLKSIKIGKHGLIIKSGYASGLLLPQVPVEQKWGVKEFLENLCLKAGLAKDEWKNMSNEIYRFTAQIYSE